MRILKLSKSSGSPYLTESLTESLTGNLEKSSKGNSNNKESGSSPSEPIDDSKKAFHRLYAKAIRLLAMREHSVKEITTKISLTASANQKSLNLVYAVIDELLSNNYLSDQRFAESYVRSRRNKGFGPVKIHNELLEKGIKNNVIDEFINLNSSIWYENAAKQYQKKYGSEPVSDYKEWIKRARFMQSRGFNTDHIHLTLPQVESD